MEILLDCIQVEKPEVYDKAPSGRLYLDGNVSVDEDAQSIKDKKKFKCKRLFGSYNSCNSKRKHSQQSYFKFLEAFQLMIGMNLFTVSKMKSKKLLEHLK